MRRRTAPPSSLAKVYVSLLNRLSATSSWKIFYNLEVVQHFHERYFIFWRLCNVCRFVRRAVALRGSAKKITPVFPSIRVDLTPMHLRLRKCRPESLNSYMQKYNTMDFVTFWSWITNSPSCQRRRDSTMGRVWWPMYSSWGELLWVLSGGQVKGGGHVWNGHLWIHPILAVPLCHFQMIQAMRIE